MSVVTQNLRMEFWTASRLTMAIEDRAALAHELGVRVPDSWPNEPVERYVLPSLQKTIERAQRAVYAGDKNHEREERPEDASSRGRRELLCNFAGVIVHRKDQCVIGTMGLKSPPTRHGVGEIGYDIIPEYRGRGYATEMASAFLDYAFQTLHLRMVTAVCLKENLASAKVLQKIGMLQVDSTESELIWEVIRV